MIILTINTRRFQRKGFRVNFNNNLDSLKNKIVDIHPPSNFIYLQI